MIRGGIASAEFDQWLRNKLDRHDFLCRNPPKCPACETEQVQLVGKAVPAQWKCRCCKHLWAEEPAIKSR